MEGGFVWMHWRRVGRRECWFRVRVDGHMDMAKAVAKVMAHGPQSV